MENYNKYCSINRSNVYFFKSLSTDLSNFIPDKNWLAEREGWGGLFVLRLCPPKLLLVGHVLCPEHVWNSDKHKHAHIIMCL